MARALFDRAKGEKELWVVPKAKHNQALTVAESEYHRRVVEFFDRHLGGEPATQCPFGDVPGDERLPRAVLAADGLERRPAGGDRVEV